ncbi:hypothetical protein E4U17_005381 [Claviceps sp. LM77 group G4]|nr:hypothetical protein E4U17_005381 [Claviceps sp. LM77 group G4]KAG6082385.1 hypothetical protein E4U33_005815 [Claviceps sp. LM78 group G4]KAG6082746.1 hypothetical protein E4U16_005607 [Claviceps sp. LM84 group G4]
MFSRILLRSTSLTTRSPRRAAMSSSHLHPHPPPAATHGSQSDPNASTTSTGSTNKPALLPSPSEGATTTLDVSGEGSTVKLDHLGPLVVNTDGTMCRIGNWAQMSSIEKENTLRIMGKRNKQRLEVLKKKAEEDSGVTGS